MENQGRSNDMSNATIYSFLIDPLYYRTELIRRAFPEYNESQVHTCLIQIARRELSDHQINRLRTAFKNHLSQLIQFNNQLQ